MKQISLFFFVLLYCVAVGYAETDIFGIKQFHPSLPGYTEWNSAHWNNGELREFDNYDSYDPTDWTEDHSATSTPHKVDGEGIMKMSGSPRFHINPTRDNNVAAQVFTNIEFTAFYRKSGSSGKNWGGMIVGMRGSSFGHGSSGGDDCDAQSYQARFRNDGKWDFEKEWKHSGTTYFSKSGYGKQDPLWGGETLPENRWIGMKYILTNVNNNTDVQLQVYIDSVSDGNPADGGTWQLLGDVTDDGTNWEGADISGCSYSDPFAPILSGGNVYWRTDNDTAEYKMVSIREIDPYSMFPASSDERNDISNSSDLTTSSSAIMSNALSSSLSLSSSSRSSSSSLSSSSSSSSSSLSSAALSSDELQTRMHDGIGYTAVQGHTYFIMNAIGNVPLVNNLKTMNPHLYISRVLSIHGKVLYKNSIGMNGQDKPDFSVPSGSYVVEMKPNLK